MRGKKSGAETQGIPTLRSLGKEEKPVKETEKIKKKKDQRNNRKVEKLNEGEGSDKLHQMLLIDQVR